MSRIFDALQKSKLEGDSPDFPPMSSLAEEVPLAAEMMEMMEDETNGVASNDVGQFQSVAMRPVPSSRLVSLTNEASLGAEKFRFLGVRLRGLRQARSLRQLLITSTIPAEGKSMVSGNLAITLAQRKEQKVLLLEGDLRRPTLSSRFGLPGLPGLSEWLRSDLGPIASIYQIEGAGFWFLPAGSPPDSNLDLMHPERLSELMKQLTRWFDWIVIDSPPLLPLADTSVWMRSADGVLLVVREGTTQKRHLQRGLQALDRSKLLGVVLNSCTNTDHDNYYYQSYGRLSVKPPAKFMIHKENPV